VWQEKHMVMTGCLQLLFCCLLVTNVFGGQVVFTSESAGMPFALEEIAVVDDIPWALAFLSPHELLVTEKRGTIRRIDIRTSKVSEIHGGPTVLPQGQGGLLDVAAPQNYTESGWLYFTFVKEKEGRGVTVLARGRLESDAIIDWQELLVSRSATDTSRHFGSRIAFDDAGHLFFSVGDRGVRPNAQNRENHAGSIIRLNLNGTVPADNPFVGSGWLPEIWSFGHRNPQGLFWDSSAQLLWAIEHGPRGGDELNIIEPGQNYGWPVVSHGKEYWGPLAVGEATSKPGMKDPVKVYIPSIAPSSLLVYSGKAFPAWKHNLFAGALALRHLNRIIVDEKQLPVGEERLLSDLGERIRDVIEGPDGFLYLSTDSGRILRIRPLATDR